MAGICKTEYHPDDICLAKDYLARPPEGLTVNGYRAFAFERMFDRRIPDGLLNDQVVDQVAGQISGQVSGQSADQAASHRAQNQMRFIDHLGAKFGPMAHDALEDLVRHLGVCATCPLRTYAPGSCHLGSDECLLLALISAIQMGDEHAMHIAIDGLSCAQKCDLVLGPAAQYAAIMKSCGAILLPFPASLMSEFFKNEMSFQTKRTQTHSNLQFHPHPQNKIH